jgi:hypothetical protein
MEGSPVGLMPTGPFTTTDHLRDPMSAFCLIQAMVPPELPEDAIP